MSNSAFQPLTMLSEDEQMLFDSVKSFAEERIKPLSREMDEKGQMDSAIIKEFFEMGLMGIEVPEKFGGAESSFFMAILAVEALSAVDPSAAIVIDVQNTLVNNAILRWGSDQIKEKYLPQLCSSKIGSYALSEAGSGSDAFALKCRAEDKGDYWLLNGQKLWITNAAEAEIFIVFANANPEAGYKGINAFIIERDFEGFSVGKKEDKLGIRASSTCELILENCKVPKENVLGEVGKGYKVAIETLNEGRIGIGAQMIGVAQGALDAAVQYTQEREQFGKAIATFQGVQFQLAEAATELEAARLLVYNAARLKDAGQKFIKEAAMAKYFASQVAQKITSLAIDLFGGYGFTKEYPVEKLFRDAKIGTIYEGTSNMQLITIAKQLLS
ncbi:acyl-CoA dehydrogenase domain-containing protein [Caldithrix abyssi DSM 13497]|uniref:Short/branched chain specific acyl-CoA dehydrogenase, mitochondrial n=1 Tax=Caldithrix abyssi DSM 13497 TaxID=880073 RepID=H1XXQ0_CALAY|nr:acyl-CoA dehydrogenase [Caldithrix abyssi]APF19601.1 butyryl-CoA dehydrogenase/short/branched chain acyl-CoA dehydrogenase [Caldithrix abyssi DSM 13497]EHO39723.1 acyl-CoA dehydrogenase domain-containing protein [Caldithrix abyssi DSM 13497]